MSDPTNAAEILALPVRNDADKLERFSVRAGILLPKHYEAGFALEQGFLAARDPDGQWWRAVHVASGAWRRVPFSPPVKDNA